MNGNRSLTTLVVGLVLILVGGVFLAANLGLWKLNWWRLVEFVFPLLLCLWGLSKLTRHFAWDLSRLNQSPSKGGLLGGFFWLSVGLVWLLDLLGVVEGLNFFGLFWPGVLVLFGLGKIFDYYRFQGQSQFRAGEVIGLLFVILAGVSAKAAADAHLPLLRLPVWIGDEEGGIRIGDYLGRKFSFTTSAEAPAAGVKVLEIANIYGNVTLEPGSSDKVTVRLTKEVTGLEETDAKTLADRVEITFASAGESVLRVGTNRAELPSSKGRFNSHLVLTAPASLAVNISNEYGDVRTSGFAGPVTVDNSYGDVDVEDVAGNVQIKNRYRSSAVRRVGGDVKIENQRGRVLAEEIAGGVQLSTERDNLTARQVGGDALVRNQYGSVTLDGIEGSARVEAKGSSVTLSGIGKDVVAENSYRAFQADELRGGLELDTSNCSVEVSSVAGPVIIRAEQAAVKVSELDSKVTVKARGSEVRLSEIAGGFDIATSLRSVTIEDFSGRGEVQNEYGDITLRASEPLTEALTAANKNGQISLYLPDNSNLKISAQASGGRVSSDFNPQAEAGDESPAAVEATLGRGGPLVRLQTSYGQIQIRKN